MSTDCEHPLCAIIGGTCSLAARRSRGCRPNLSSKDTAPEVIDEVRQLLTVIADHTDDVRPAAVRLAAIVRRETLEDRNLIAILSSNEPELAPALSQLCRRAITKN